VIANRLPKKQKAQSGSSAKGLISIQEVTALCDRHQYSHLIEAPVRTPILAGAVIHTAEAARTRNPIIRLLAVNLKENHSDLPFLPDRM
jgi:hypothetical protein